jgi:pyruvate dehydrogenase E2 component (dihydrolipoamide acetyltransferase)
MNIDLQQLNGSGYKGRITSDDVYSHLKNQQNSSGFSLPPAPEIDFSQFGPIETQTLSKIKKLTAKNMQRNWLSIPMVTQFDEADITELEAFRQAQKNQYQGLTLLPFVIKALTHSLKQFPQFNASLDNSGEQLILKKYYHFGVAVDTPNGLVVGVLRDADQKGVFTIATELQAMGQKAREKGLSIQEMQGQSFTISSLGGIGGTAFTPIVNAPDVAILGLSRSRWQPVYQQDNLVKRLILPLSLTYDHRVIDGAEAARFCRYLADTLADLRLILMN